MSIDIVMVLSVKGAWELIENVLSEWEIYAEYLLYLNWLQNGTDT